MKYIRGIKTCTRRWTKSAEDCYMLGCDCSKCDTAVIMESKCCMKPIVLELVRKFGAPKIDREEGKGYASFEEIEQEKNQIYFEEFKV